MLRPADRETLKRLGYPFKVSISGGFTTVQIIDVPLGPGLQPDKVTILLRLPPGFLTSAPTCSGSIRRAHRERGRHPGHGVHGESPRPVVAALEQARHR